MKQKYDLRFLLFSDGRVTLTSDVFEKKYSLLHSFTYIFPSISELLWIKGLIEGELEKDELTYTGLNTFRIGVDKEIVYLSHNYDPNFVQTVPLSLVFDFIDNCIAMLDLYNSGGIPRIIPESKKDDWVIVPKAVVDKKYWNMTTDENNKREA